MTPADFRSWQARMGLTVRAAAELLGVAPSTVQDWRTGVSRRTGRPIELPHMLGLACAALAAGIGPWTTAEQSSAVQIRAASCSVVRRGPYFSSR